MEGVGAAQGEEELYSPPHVVDGPPVTSQTEAAPPAKATEAEEHNRRADGAATAKAAEEVEAKPAGGGGGPVAEAVEEDSSGTGSATGEAEPAEAERSESAPSTPPAPLPTEGPEAEITCRICLEGDSALSGPLIAPCRCSGSMKYVHRSCLDEWRVSCFSPKALMECNTCRTPFRTQYVGTNKNGYLAGKPWWVRFALDVAKFLAVRVGGFLFAASILGFWPHLVFGFGVANMHENPVRSHLFTGIMSAFAFLGSWILLQVPIWHFDTLHSVRLVMDALCPHRQGHSSVSDILLVILIILGVCCCLWVLICGILNILREGGNELAKAARGANKQARQRVVSEWVVVDFDADSDNVGNVSSPAPADSSTGRMQSL